MDEQKGHTGWGRCNVPRWLGGPFAGPPYPEDYHQNWTNRRGGVDWIYVFDHHNDRVVMVYNETTIFYLYPPSYGREWYESVEASG